MNRFFVYLLIIFIPLFAVAQKNIFFEIDNIFFEVDEARHTKETNIFGSLFENSIKYYSEKFFELLDSIKDYDEYKQQNLLYKDKILPSIMCAYQLDILDSKSIIKRLETEIKKIYSCFSIERNILLHATKLSFNPEHEISCMYPLQLGMQIALKCLSNPENKIFILSNKNTNTMQALFKKHEDFFSNFDRDNIIISGQSKRLKPNIKFYEFFLEKYNLEPSDCYFIESDHMHIETIKQISGTNFILCKNKDFLDLEQQLILFNIIK